MITKNNTWISLFIGCFLLISCTPLKESPPNIIFFLVDDLGWMDVSFRDSTFYETPNIDDLSNRSMIQSSLCLTPKMRTFKIFYYYWNASRKGKAAWKIKGLNI